MARPIKLVVIDYESGNLRSVAKALESVNVSPLVTGQASELESADAVVLPGVGSGPAAMEALAQRGLVEPVRDYVASGRPFLGVCLGLQLLLDRTEEGDAPCLGLIPGVVKTAAIRIESASHGLEHRSLYGFASSVSRDPSG